MAKDYTTRSASLPVTPLSACGLALMRGVLTPLTSPFPSEADQRALSIEQAMISESPRLTRGLSGAVFTSGIHTRV